MLPAARSAEQLTKDTGRLAYICLWRKLSQQKSAVAMS